MLPDPPDERLELGTLYCTRPYIIIQYADRYQIILPLDWHVWKWHCSTMIGSLACESFILSSKNEAPSTVSNEELPKVLPESWKKSVKLHCSFSRMLEASLWIDIPQQLLIIPMASNYHFLVVVSFDFSVSVSVSDPQFFKQTPDVHDSMENASTGASRSNAVATLVKKVNFLFNIFVASYEWLLVVVVWHQCIQFQCML